MPEGVRLSDLFGLWCRSEREAMSDKATIVIDCAEGTVSVETNEGDLRAMTRQIETTKATLVATIVAMQSRELMALSKQELMARHLAMLER
jgi:argininosuccinate synthase